VNADPLTPLQVQATRLFFSLPASAGFAVAGGAALIARGLGRAEPRDFADVHDLAQRYGRDRLLQWAAEDDPGFDRQVFADMLATIDRLTDTDLPVSPRQATALRAWIHDWAAELQPDPARSPARTEAYREAVGQDPERE
jgi:hypothetical protein